MSDFLNRTTLKYQNSRPDDISPDPPWLEIPPGSGNATVIATVDPIYWVLEGDNLREMDAAEKAAKDAQIENDLLLASRADTVDGIDNSNNSVALSDRELIVRLTKTHNKLANRIRQTQQVLEAMRTSTGGTANLRAAIPNASQDVLAEPPLPATMDRLQNRVRSEEIQGFKDDINNGEADA